MFKVNNKDTRTTPGVRRPILAKNTNIESVNTYMNKEYHTFSLMFVEKRKADEDIF